MDAVNAPRRRGRKEIHTDDLDYQQPSSIILPNDGHVMAHEPEEIAILEGQPEEDYAAQLAFAEDVLTIRLEPSSEKHAPKIIDVYVNGRAEWIPVGTPYKVRRKYVEVLARAKPDTIDTESGEVPGDELTKNIIHRYTSSKYPFSVIHDPAGSKGVEWLTRIYAER